MNGTVQHDPDRPHTGPDRVVVGIDQSDESVDALRWAVDYAAERGDVYVDVVSTWDVEPLNFGIETVQVSPPHGQPAERLARLDQVMWWVRPELSGVDARTALVPGTAGPALVEYATGANMLVLGRPTHSGLSRTISYVLHHSMCPVVLVPDGHRLRAGAAASVDDAPRELA